MRRRFGQHLLKNKSIAQKIVALGELTPSDTVLEIGPGRGMLTEEIIKSGAQVIAVEIDKRFCSYLRSKFTSASFTLIEGDILKIDWGKTIGREKLKVISNLPYYLTAPLLFKLFEWREYISLMVFTMQLEVAQRLVARPSTKDYGILSIAAQYYTIPSLAFKLLPGSFHPPPRVSSGVVKMEVKRDCPLEDEAFFFRMVRTIFNKRRKMLVNTLKEVEGIEKDKIFAYLEDAHIEGRRRPETLSLEELYRLYNILYQKICGLRE